MHIALNIPVLFHGSTVAMMCTKFRLKNARRNFETCDVVICKDQISCGCECAHLNTDK